MMRRVLVTGAAGGIGAATCRRFERDGWEVLALDRDWPEAPPATALTVDLGDASMIEAALADVGPLDALVNNAALHEPRPIVETEAESFTRILDVNLRAAALLTKVCAEGLIKRQGAIVNVASVHALASGHGMAAYAAAKAGLLGLTRVTAVELGPRGVRANAVLPGAVETAMLLPGLGAAARAEGIEALSARTPLGRVGSPEEIAAAISFLADSSEASFITGQTLVVDGGATARLASE